MSHERLHLPDQVTVETGMGRDGRWYSVQTTGAIHILHNPGEIESLMTGSVGKTSRAALHSWLNGLHQYDQNFQG